MIVYRELSSLESDLGFSAKELYILSNSIDRQYRNVQIPKHDGTYRSLLVPSLKLKSVQRAIAEKILAYMPVSTYATAYRYGASVQKNAKMHVGKAKLLKLDIYHFFDSIRYQQVKEKVFTAERFSEPLRILLSMLCYHRDALPQGAPSSPAITNIIMYDFDNIVGKWCNERKISYTRYCDDMTFSGDFDHRELTAFVREELNKLGFILNGKKTRLITSGKRQTVTGLVVNRKVAVAADYKRELRREIYYCKKYGVSEHLKHTNARCSEKQYLQSLLGKVSFALQAEPGNTRIIEAKKFITEQIKK